MQMNDSIIVPLILVFVSQTVGFLNINLPVSLIICAVKLLLDIAALYLASRLFQREAILTRWR